MTISTHRMHGVVREDNRASTPYVTGPIMRQARPSRSCEASWYQQLVVMLVVAVGIGGQVLTLWIIGQIVMLWWGA
jgi:hypothetical protein